MGKNDTSYIHFPSTNMRVVIVNTYVKNSEKYEKSVRYQRNNVRKYWKTKSHFRNCLCARNTTLKRENLAFVLSNNGLCGVKYWSRFHRIITLQNISHFRVSLKFHCWKRLEKEKKFLKNHKENDSWSKRISRLVFVWLFGKWKVTKEWKHYFIFSENLHI